jgi:hypothetical protein
VGGKISRLAQLVPKTRQGRILAASMVGLVIVLVIVAVVTTIANPQRQPAQVKKIYQGLRAGRTRPDCLVKGLAPDHAASLAAQDALKPYISGGTPRIRSVQQGRRSDPGNPPSHLDPQVYQQVYVQFGPSAKAPWVALVLGPKGELCGVGNTGLVPANRLVLQDPNDDTGM